MKHLSNGSDFCQFLYDTAASDPGRNLVFETDGQRVIVIQKAEDADIVMRRNLANYPKNLRWFEQVAGNSRLTDEGEAWKFRWSLSQPFFSKYDAERGYEVSLIHARNMARRLPQAQGVLLDEWRGFHRGPRQDGTDGYRWGNNRNGQNGRDNSDRPRRDRRNR